jgi:hypothetical protein
VGLLGDMLSAKLVGDMLSMEFVGVVVGWLWRNGMTDSMPEVELGLFEKLVMEKVRDKMESVVDDEGSIAWCS